MAGERVKAERLRGVEITDEKPCDGFSSNREVKSKTGVDRHALH